MTHRTNEKSARESVQLLSERLAVMENRLRRVHRTELIMAGLIVFAILAAASSPISTIEASRLVMRDGSGTVRGEWSVDNKSSNITLFDAAGLRRLSIGSDTDGAALRLFDDSSQLRVAVGAYAASQGVGVYDSDRVARVGLGLNAAGPALGLFGSDGRLQASVVPLPVASPENFEPSVTFDMGEFQSLMNEGKGTTYMLRARILLSADRERSDAGNVKRELIERRSELRDAINIVMLGVSPSSFIGDAATRKRGYVSLREGIRTEINSLLKYKIDGVYIEEFVFQ